jgi:histidine phosphotransfer protein HptB
MTGNVQLVNWDSFSQARAELGANFVRILGYFREDGVKSVARIEEAMRANNAASMVIPAHTLKGESDLAETIEMSARLCMERQDTPTDVLEHVVQLRPLFEATLALLERESNPLVERRPVFGRRSLAG